MRPRTPSIIWLPFVFSVGTISWAFLLAGLVLLAAVILTPALKDVKAAEARRNDYQATLDLLDQKIALQKQFIEAADKDPVLLDRLASRQLNIHRQDQELLVLDPPTAFQDNSVDNLIRQSLTTTTPKPVTPLPAIIANTVGNPAVRPLVVTIALCSLALSFFLGVKYERH